MNKIISGVTTADLLLKDAATPFRTAVLEFDVEARPPVSPGGLPRRYITDGKHMDPLFWFDLLPDGRSRVEIAVFTEPQQAGFQLKEPLRTAMAARDEEIARESMRRTALFDSFRGPTTQLVECMRALVMMDVEGKVVPHGIGTHARTLLASAAHRLARATPLDVDGSGSGDDPMLAYYSDWYGLQSLKGDPSRRPDLARDAYLSGAAQGALLALRERRQADRDELLYGSSFMVDGKRIDPARVTFTVRQVDKSADLHGQPVDETANLHEPSKVTVAECIAQLDLWAGRLEAAIDRTAQVQLGQHPNDDEPAAGGRDPMEQLP